MLNQLSVQLYNDVVAGSVMFRRSFCCLVRPDDGSYNRRIKAPAFTDGRLNRAELPEMAAPDECFACRHSPNATVQTTEPGAVAPPGWMSAEVNTAAGSMRLFPAPRKSRQRTRRFEETYG